jgi:hypothetical protein
MTLFISFVERLNSLFRQGIQQTFLPCSFALAWSAMFDGMSASLVAIREDRTFNNISQQVSEAETDVDG